jgi:hypothetical protein
MIVHIIYILLVIVVFIIGFMLGISKADEHDRIADQYEKDDNREANTENGKRIIEQARNRKEEYLKQINKAQ